jgi:drug/metabolite transporter (DMT)-like permease
MLAAFGIVSIGFGEIFTVLGLANLKAQTGSLLALIEPVSGIFFDVAVLGIMLSSEVLAGCALIMASAVFISLNDSEKIKEKSRRSAFRKVSKEALQKIHFEK